jgi:hypothetical protein
MFLSINSKCYIDEAFWHMVSFSGSRDQGSGFWIIFLNSYLLLSALCLLTPVPRPLIPDQAARGVPHINLLISFGFKIEGRLCCTLFCALCTIFCAKRV